MDQRTQAVQWVAAGVAVSEVAERSGVSRQVIYNWLERYRADPEAGLNDRSRRPHHSPTRTAEAIERRIIEERTRWKFGSKKIRRRLQDQHPDVAWPPRSTIDAILKRAGLVSGRRPVRQRFAPAAARRSCQACSPGEVMTADSYTGISLEQTWATFVRVFREHGLPNMLHTDNGTPFGTSGNGRFSTISVRLMKYGVQPVYSRPGHPGDNGRHERLNRTLLESTVIDPAYNHAGQQILFDEFRRVFNEERPHESLGQDRPVSRHRRAPRTFPGREPVIEYEPLFETRIVGRKGYINWLGERVYFSDAFAGEPIGFERIDSEAWRVHYASFVIGRFSSADKRLV